VNRGLLIVFEGLDGCGKSTQLERLAARLRERGLDPLVTREPTDGEWGQRIRTMARSGERVAPEVELDWFTRDREEHVRDELLPAIEAGRVVLCDRYFLSTVAYQGARGLDAAELLRESEAAFPAPDLALLFEVDAETGLERVAARGGVAEPAFEERNFLERVAKIFARLERPYLVSIDARPGPDEVERSVDAAIAKLGLA